MKKTAENLIQQRCVVYFNNKYCLNSHDPRCVIFSVPNESENAWETQKKINTGLMKGAADCIILLPNSVCLFMECKTDIGVQSPAQKAFQIRVETLGFHYYIYRSLDEFQTILKHHITWLKEF